MTRSKTAKRMLLPGIIGCIGSLGMFAGDMLLYFTAAAYDPAGGLMEYARIMAGFPTTRLIAGSVLGPVCSILYCIGFTQLLYAVKPEGSKAGKVLFACFCLSWVIGGAYHSQFGAMGVAMQLSAEATQAVADYVMAFYALTMAIFAVAAVLLVVLVLVGRTRYPRWFVLLTPAVLIWLPLDLLPQPFRIILMGGWTNLMFLPFFIVSTKLLLSSERKLLT